MKILKIRIYLFFKLFKYRLPSYYLYFKRKLHRLNYKDMILNQDCLLNIEKDRKEMLKFVEKRYKNE